MFRNAPSPPSALLFARACNSRILYLLMFLAKPLQSLPPFFSFGPSFFCFLPSTYILSIFLFTPAFLGPLFFPNFPFCPVSRRGSPNLPFPFLCLILALREVAVYRFLSVAPKLLSRALSPLVFLLFLQPPWRLFFSSTPHSRTVCSTYQALALRMLLSFIFYVPLLFYFLSNLKTILYSGAPPYLAEALASLYFSIAD